jgi:hypothetical protein
MGFTPAELLTTKTFPPRPLPEPVWENPATLLARRLLWQQVISFACSVMRRGRSPVRFYAYPRVATAIYP